VACRSVAICQYFENDDKYVDDVGGVFGNRFR
jgi:hypothetical protein